ncbi:CD24 isoform 3, partial [Pongo abelii]
DRSGPGHRLRAAPTSREGFALGGARVPSARIYSIETTTGISINTSQSTSNFGTAPNPTNATTKAAGGALQSTASLFVVSLSLLHLYC